MLPSERQQIRSRQTSTESNLDELRVNSYELYELGVTSYADVAAGYYLAHDQHGLRSFR